MINAFKMSYWNDNGWWDHWQFMVHIRTSPNPSSDKNAAKAVGNRNVLYSLTSNKEVYSEVSASLFVRYCFSSQFAVFKFVIGGKVRTLSFPVFFISILESICLSLQAGFNQNYQLVKSLKTAWEKVNFLMWTKNIWCEKTSFSYYNTSHLETLLENALKNKISLSSCWACTVLACQWEILSFFLKPIQWAWPQHHACFVI